MSCLLFFECLCRGVDLQWLSAFPNESQVLFPPLTYMQPTGKMQVMQRRDASGITLVT